MQYSERRVFFWHRVFPAMRDSWVDGPSLRQRLFQMAFQLYNEVMLGGKGAAETRVSILRRVPTVAWGIHHGHRNGIQVVQLGYASAAFQKCCHFLIRSEQTWNFCHGLFPFSWLPLRYLRFLSSFILHVFQVWWEYLISFHLLSAAVFPLWSLLLSP